MIVAKAAKFYLENVRDELADIKHKIDVEENADLAADQEAPQD